MNLITYNLFYEKIKYFISQKCDLHSSNFPINILLQMRHASINVARIY